jgi:hypothetical protein
MRFLLAQIYRKAHKHAAPKGRSQTLLGEPSFKEIPQHGRRNKKYPWRFWGRCLSCGGTGDSRPRENCESTGHREYYRRNNMGFKDADDAKSTYNELRFDYKVLPITISEKRFRELMRKIEGTD